MRNYSLMMSLWLGLGVFALAGSIPEAMAAPQDAPLAAVNPAAARVWFLRQSDPVNGNVEGAAPVVFANGAALGELPEGSDFYRDFPPGTYSFTVQPYGLPTGQAETVQLAPGTETYLQVQWAQTWEEGYAGGPGLDSSSFFVTSMSPQLAQAYLPTLTNLGQR